MAPDRCCASPQAKLADQMGYSMKETKFIKGGFKGERDHVCRQPAPSLVQSGSVIECIECSKRWQVTKRDSTKRPYEWVQIPS